MLSKIMYLVAAFTIWNQELDEHGISDSEWYTAVLVQVPFIDWCFLLLTLQQLTTTDSSTIAVLERKK